jgi:CBS domain-containing protein/PII-like signaling protein
MTSADSIQRVRIYLSRSDTAEGGPRYLALLERLRREGASGATAIQGLAGFGPGQRTRAGATSAPAARQPVIIEWLDRADRVARLLPLLDDLIGTALVTCEDVPIYRAVLRASGPFGADRSAGNTMRSPAPSAPVGAALGEALALLIEHAVGALPIVDEANLLVGLLAGQDLAWRAGMRLEPELIDLLGPAERDALLAPLIGRSLREVMQAEPRSVAVNASLPQAIAAMIEWGYAHIPVIDRGGRLVGLLGQDDILRAAIAQAPAGEAGVQDAEPPTSVRLVMQTIAPQIALGRPLAAAIELILAAPRQRLLVTDGAGRLHGTMSLAGVIRALAGEERAALIAAIQRPQPAPAASLPGAARPLDDLVERDTPSLAPAMTIAEAARHLLDLGAESLPVVDMDGRLLGIIARGGLIRALLQQSE